MGIGVHPRACVEMPIQPLGQESARARRYRSMRSVTGLCTTMGTLIGGYVPSLWGDSGFSLASVVFAAVGGAVGLWAAIRLQA